MSFNLSTRWRKLQGETAVWLLHPVCLGSLPAACLILYLSFGQMALVTVAVLFPLFCLIVGTGSQSQNTTVLVRSAVQGVLQRDAFREIAATHFETAHAKGLRSALFKVEIDAHEELIDRYGQSAADTVVETIGARILTAMRDEDAVAQTADFRFSISLVPVRQLDLELCLQMAGRLQTAAEEPISIDGATVYVSVCVGFCQITKVLDQDAKNWIAAANFALRQAQHNGPNAIRAYSEEMRKNCETRAELREEVGSALESGHIQPWFQPQISTDTGLVTGFEALARWDHPQHGIIPPSSFLPAIEQTGMLERLAEVMMFHAFTALKSWDKAGVDVPQVGVNFAGPELNNPKLVDKVKWELDRFGLTPDRLAVEVLETVVANAPDDTVTRNIHGLSALGCRIDLDDFGTGHASIASIRRFEVSRIKIDRSFVMKSDRDPEQQRMISAILTMAERLNVETLAEGVETVGEHALLSQLGCDHVQGFGIAKPMPFEDTIAWVTAHSAKLEATPKILGNKF